jgi:mycothiol synthase
MPPVPTQSSIPPSIPLPPGYTVSAPTMADMERVCQLIAACSLTDHGEIDFTLGDIRTYWTTSIEDLSSDAWMVLSPQGELVAEADVARRAPNQLWCYANVHRKHVGRGIGTYLLARAEQRLRAWAEQAPPQMPVMARQELSAADARARELLERHGYAPVRRSWRMQIEMGEPPAQPTWPMGISVRPFVPGRDEYAVYEAMEEAFAQHWGHVPRTFDEYTRWHFQGERYDPSLYFLAMDGDTIAACALCRLRGEMGRVGSLGVRRAYRRRRIAQSLLRHAFAEFYGRGERAVDLIVDSENATGAVQLYERAGMRVVREWVEYAKELRPGAEASEGIDA